MGRLTIKARSLEVKRIWVYPLSRDAKREFEEHACDLATERNPGDAVVLLIIKAYYLRVLIPRLKDANDIADAHSEVDALSEEAWDSLLGEPWSATRQWYTTKVMEEGSLIDEITRVTGVEFRSS
ncbi:hypothetical protein PTMSG1_02025 [Pyrenophora teres f. maculata]|nr:hypothetical protein PTMSG1_02025 [Pyrenophora teres f. maculata]